MKTIEDTIVICLEDSLTAFREAYPNEDIYGVALVRSAVGDHVHLAIATEQRLEACAADYSNNLNLGDKKKWLRWANPDDGWYQETFSQFEAADTALKAAIAAGELEEFDQRFNELFSSVIKRVVEANDEGTNVAFGITHGEDPQDFVYWASRLNSAAVNERVASQYAESQQIEQQIEFD